MRGGEDRGCTPQDIWKDVQGKDLGERACKRCETARLKVSLFSVVCEESASVASTGFRKVAFRDAE